LNAEKLRDFFYTISERNKKEQDDIPYDLIIVIIAAHGVMYGSQQVKKFEQNNLT